MKSHSGSPSKREHNELKALLEKTETLKKCARAVILVDQEGNVKGTRIQPVSLALYDNIVVTGPTASHPDKELVRLEIGFGRSAPYAEFRWFEEGRKRALRGRKHLSFTPEELLKVMPAISETIQSIVDEWTLSRTSLLCRYTKKNGIVRKWWRGLSLTVSQNDPMLVYALLLLNQESRKREFLKTLAEEIRKLLRGYKRVSYSKKQLLAKKSVLIVKEKLHLRYSQDQTESILGFFKPGGKIRSLVESIINTLSVEPRTILAPHELSFLKLKERYGHFNGEIRKAFRLSITTHPKRDEERTFHAKGCLRVEVLGSIEVREEHEKKIWAKGTEISHERTEDEEMELIPF